MHSCTTEVGERIRPGAGPRRLCEQHGRGGEPGGAHGERRWEALTWHQEQVTLRGHLGGSQHPPPSIPKPPPSRIWDRGLELGALSVVDGL